MSADTENAYLQYWIWNLKFNFGIFVYKKEIWRIAEDTKIRNWNQTKDSFEILKSGLLHTYTQENFVNETNNFQWHPSSINLQLAQYKFNPSLAQSLISHPFLQF